MMKKLLFVLMLLVAHATQATVYYVSATGSDLANGMTTGTAWQTLTKVNATTFSAGDQILFKKGDGWYGTLTPKNSGSTGNVITFSTYGTGATPTITGFTTITSGWTNEGGGIYSKVITSESQTNMVTIDGVQYGMGRYPNSTFLTYESASGYVSITDNELTGTPNWTGAEAVIYKNGYRYERDLITSHSGGTLNYTIVSGSNMNASAPNKYFIQNDLRTLDSYGEWYHDFLGTGKFYMYFGAVDPTTKTVKVATLNNLCKVNTTKTYITIDGLSLTGSIGQAFIAESNCHYLTIQNSNISFAGSDGVYIDGENATINNSTFNYCNRVSSMIVGANATITNNSISNNAVILGQSFGWSGLSALIVVYDNATVTGNSIQNCATNGIFVHESVDVGLVKNNYIYNSCIHNWDHGSIYTANPHTDLDIEDNIIVKSGGYGIYVDEVGAYVTVKNNTISECSEAGIQLHKSNNITIQGNTIYNCTYGLKLLSWVANKNYLHNITSSGNKIVAKTATQIAFHYATIATRFDSTFTTSSFSGNIYGRPIDETTFMYWNVPGNSGNKTLAQWKSFSSLDANSTGSPKSITTTDDIAFAYNATATAATVNLPFPGIDMAGNRYGTSPVLSAYSSIVILKDLTNPSGTLQPLGIPGTGQVLGIPATGQVFGKP